MTRKISGRSFGVEITLFCQIFLCVLNILNREIMHLLFCFEQKLNMVSVLKLK